MQTLFHNDPNDDLKSVLVQDIIEIVERLFQEPNSKEDGHFGVAAELANAYTRSAILRAGADKVLTEDDQTEISATAGALLDENWVVSIVKK